MRKTDTFKKVEVRYDGAVGSTAFNVSSTAISNMSARFVKGIHKDDLIDDPITGYYYVDINVIATANGSAFNIEKDVELTPQNPYVEGYKILSMSEGESFSNRDVPILYLSRYINDLNLTVASTSLDVDFNYTTGTSLVDIQNFIDLDENRIIAEDILVKHYTPVNVILNISGKGLLADKGLELLETFIASLEATFEVSDLISYLYTNGATRVDLPIEVILERMTNKREQYNSFVSNTITISSSEKFYFSSASTYTVTT